MRVKALKEELDGLNVAWKGVAFEKEELIRLLESARANPPAPPPPPAEPAAEPEAAAATADTADESAAYDAAYETAFADAMKLKAKDLKGKLAARNTGWADLYEKEEMAARLAALVARSALFSRSGALSPGAVGVVDAEQLMSEMADDRTPMVIDVFATWCGPCKLISPMLESLATTAGERCRFAKLDSDDNPELSTELRVAGLPTLIFMKGGAEVHRLEGVPGNKAALEQLANQYLGLGL